MNPAQGFRGGRYREILPEISYYGKEGGGEGRARMALVSELPICNVYSFAREWAGRTCWYPDLHSHLRLNLCLRPRSIVWPSVPRRLLGNWPLWFNIFEISLCLSCPTFSMDICEPNESFFKKICIYVYIYIYICVGTVYGVDIEPVASCSIDDEKNKWGREKKKRKKERRKGTYRSVAEDRNSA